MHQYTDFSTCVATAPMLVEQPIAYDHIWICFIGFGLIFGFGSTMADIVVKLLWKISLANTIHVERY